MAAAHAVHYRAPLDACDVALVRIHYLRAASQCTFRTRTSVPVPSLLHEHGHQRNRQQDLCVSTKADEAYLHDACDAWAVTIGDVCLRSSISLLSLCFV